VKRPDLLAAGAAALVLFPAAANAATGPQLWSQSGCGGCHTLQAAGSSGTVGPNLDTLRPSAAAVADQVTSGGGGMPSFGGSLSATDIQALSRWVSRSAGGASNAAPNSLSTAATRRLQRDLKTLSLFHGPVTGFYGPLTTAAVKRFQRSAGLTADGIWGPKSALALRHRLGG
jgi:mono/diheme cytochrome c family protein